MTSQISSDAFWLFSLALYPKVKATCLRLQDDLDANVNLLLLLCYLEQQQLSLSSVQIDELRTSLLPFSIQFTQPLRALRRQSDNELLSYEQQQQLRQTLLNAELNLEQLEQQLLVKHCPSLLTKAQPLLEIYLTQLNADSATCYQAIIDLRQAFAQQA